MGKSRLFCMFVSALVFSLCLTACGGGGGGEAPAAPTPTAVPTAAPAPAPAPVPSWTGPVNASGFPDVDGKYSFNTGTILASCTDGVSVISETFPARAMNFEILQKENQLLFHNLNASVPSDSTVIESTSGIINIDKTGYFIATQRTILTDSSLPGKNTVNYSLTGYFSMTGWRGNYQWVLYNDYSKVTCTYTTTFTGDYVGPSAKTAQAKDNPYEEAEQAVEMIPLEGNGYYLGFLFGLP